MRAANPQLPRIRMPKSYLAVAAAVFLILTLTTLSYPYLATADFWDHSSAAKELSLNPTDPTDPLLNLKVDNPRNSPYIFLIAMVMRLSGMDVFAAFKIFSLLNLLLFISAFFLFTTALMGWNLKERKTMPALCLIMALFFWGFGWNISSAYHLKILMFVLPYPSFFSFGLAIFLLYIVLKYLREKKTSLIILLIILGSALLLTHFPTFSFFLTSMLLLAFFEGEGGLKERVLWFIPFTAGFRKERLFIALLPILLVALTAFWPYYSFLALLALGKESTLSSMVLNDILLKTGPLLIIGLPLWLVSFRDKKLRLAWLLFAFNFLAFLVYYLTRIPFTERYFFYMAFYLQILIAAKYGEYGVLSTASWKGMITRMRVLADRGLGALRKMRLQIYWDLLRTALALVLALSIVFQLLLVGTFFQKYFEGRIEDVVDMDEYPRLKNVIGTYDVFITDEKTSLVLPTFTGRSMGHYLNHWNAFVTDYRERSKDMALFFKEETSDTERSRILQRYDVSFIVINLMYTDISLIETAQGFGELAFLDDSFAVVRVRRSGQA